jgi:hypothetical protein
MDETGNSSCASICVLTACCCRFWWCTHTPACCSRLGWFCACFCCGLAWLLDPIEGLCKCAVLDCIHGCLFMGECDNKGCW